ncbi:unnamed protein product [Adineta steineri]|uniref:NHL repeat containing protein n=1 Tax=Adineta steineri TaxID=433720 RepID=A0A813S2G9_9BILA|nr:unnamed protein product [Adineta steineri]
MADGHLKYLSIKSIIIINIVFLLDKVSALSHNCSTTVWALNATTIAGSPTGIQGFTSTLLSFPRAITVGTNDSIYVIDFSSPYYRMQLFYPGSQLGTTIIYTTKGAGLNQLSGVNSLTIDANGNVYILEASNTRVTKWAPGASTGIVVAGNNGQSDSLNTLNTPWDMFVEPNTSYIWIADTYNSRIVKWVNTSTAILIAGGPNHGLQANQLYKPQGLFVDTSDSNTLYVADTYNHRIQKWLYGASNGTTVAGQSGVSGADLDQLFYPRSLAVDSKKSLYIVDYQNNRVVLWLLGATTGIVLAGSLAAGVLPSQLNTPFNVRLDSTGAFIVNDYGNYRIQRFPVLCSPNITSSSSSSTTSVATTLQNTTIVVPLTTNNLTTSANNSTTKLSTSTSQNNSLTNAITNLSSNHSFATPILISLIFLFIVLTDRTCHTIAMILVTNSYFADFIFTLTLFWLIMFTLYNDLQQIYYKDLFRNFRVYNPFCIYVIPINGIEFIYLKLIRYVREMNKRVILVNILLRGKKELKMVFRLVILISIFLIFVFMRIFTSPPKYHFRIALTFIEISTVFVMIILFKFTDPVRTSIMKRINRQSNIVVAIMK